jgi:acyl phosphate:glycerol-3-phosphate acyltransferase
MALIAPVVLIAAYLLGSIPTGVLLARTAGIDPRRVGSGNIGATNVARTAGGRLGVFTLIGDVLKGTLAVLAAEAISGEAWLCAAAGLAAIAGHLWSCFLRFHGGKGVATTAGVFLVLAPLATLAAVFMFAIAARAFRYVSLASVLAALTLPAASLALARGPEVTLAALMAAIAIIAKHHENIQRLRAGTEPKFGLPRSA